MKIKQNRRRRGLLGALAASTILGLGLAQPGAAHDNDHDYDYTKTPIKHVVVIFQENISFDHYFGTYPYATNPTGEPKFHARDDTPSVDNLMSAGLLTNNPNLFNPQRLDPADAYTCSQDHDYTDEQKAQDGGLMDKFVQAGAHLGVGCNDNGSTVMNYYDGNTVTALWNYAQHYAMSDNSFGTTFGPSTTGAINLISGQIDHGLHALTFAGGQVATSEPVSVTGDPDPALDDCGNDKGGTAGDKETVQMAESNKNIGDLLNAKHITWGWFQGGFAPTSPAVVAADGSTITPAVCGASSTGHPNVPNPTVHPGEIHTSGSDYSAHHEPFQYYKSTRNPHHLRPASVAEIGHNGPANHQYDISDFFAALAAHNLPAVSYIKAKKFQDGHPGNSDPISEQTFIVDVINALMKSPEWRNTVVIVSYDDTDGWYDHVPSPIVNPTAYHDGEDGAEYNGNDARTPALPLATSVAPANPDAWPSSGLCGSTQKGGIGTARSSASPRCGYGPRMPFMVISPWSKENYVDHTLTDQTSSLAFIEYNWNLGYIDGSTPPAPDQASYDRIAGSILNMFDFDDDPNARPLLLDDQTGEVIHPSPHHGHRGW